MYNMDSLLVRKDNDASESLKVPKLYKTNSYGASTSAWVWAYTQTRVMYTAIKFPTTLFACGSFLADDSYHAYLCVEITLDSPDTYSIGDMCYGNSMDSSFSPWRTPELIITYSSSKLKMAMKYSTNSGGAWMWWVL